MFLEEHQMEKLEISSAVQNMVAAMQGNPDNFEVELGLLSVYHVKDLTTGIEGGVYFNKNNSFGYVDYTCVGDLSFMNGKEAEAVHKEILQLLTRKVLNQEDEAKLRFENAYRTPQESRG